MTATVPTATASDHHLDAVSSALEGLRAQLPLLERWGVELASRLDAGQRLLVAGNGGSAAQAQHLTAELVGRFKDPDRRPLSALALHAETSSVTAIANDFGVDEVFARQVAAHGRPGDVLLLLSTSGNSPNLVAAAAAAGRAGVDTLALTGAAPNRLTGAAGACVVVDDRDTAVVQDVHQVAIHVLCGCIDRELSPDLGG